MFCGAKTVNFQNSDSSTMKVRVVQDFSVFAYWIIKMKSVSFKALQKNIYIYVDSYSLKQSLSSQLNSTVNSHFDC